MHEEKEHIGKDCTGSVEGIDMYRTYFVQWNNFNRSL